jgi:hypothetical protein
LFAHKSHLIFRIEIENPTYTNAGKYFIFFQTDFAILISYGGRFSLDKKICEFFERRLLFGGFHDEISEEFFKN